jgi:hypothetical protein
MAAGCSWLVFLIANGFSTLWIFGNLWWLPGAAVLWILAAAGLVDRRRFIQRTAKSLGLAAACAVPITASLALAGRIMTDAPRIAPLAGGQWMACDENRNGQNETVILPDTSVLGDTWGKEIRRLAGDLENTRILVPAKTGNGGDFSYPGDSPGWLVACGKEAAHGLALRARFPEAGMILVHPLGRPAIPEGFDGNATVLLPLLDTSGYGRMWRAACRKHGWNCLTSPGVGQDIRLIWPGILTELLEPDCSGGL